MRLNHRLALACAAFFAPVIGYCALAGAHGFVGDRFFPPTIATEDPFAVDELEFPIVSYGIDRDTRELDYAFEFDKEILPRFSLGISDAYISQRGRHDEPSAYGFDDLSLSAKYQLWQDDAHEAIASIGLDADIGGTGSHAVADSFSTFTPAVYFGKGFGDLPDSMWPLQPLALTGSLGQSFPTSSRAPNQFQLGMAVEYSIPYLQQHVKDLGIGGPFKNMIPLVEFAMATDENRANAGITTGTINPGVLWETPHFQLGAEAVIPINHQSGAHVGFTIQLSIFIDDLAPGAFGHPLFGKE